MELNESRLASISRPVPPVEVTEGPRWERRSMNFKDAEANFPRLNLRRDRATRVVIFDLAPMREQLRRNGLSMESIHELSQEGLRELLLAWYIECVARGGQCSAEMTAAVREIRSPNPTYRLVIRPVCNSVEGFKPSQALKHEPSQVEEGQRPAGLFMALKTKFTEFVCQGGDIEVEKPYVVPSGPELHLKPSRFRRAGLKQA